MPPAQSDGAAKFFKRVRFIAPRTRLIKHCDRYHRRNLTQNQQVALGKLLRKNVDCARQKDVARRRNIMLQTRWAAVRASASGWTRAVAVRYDSANSNNNVNTNCADAQARQHQRCYRIKCLRAETTPLSLLQISRLGVAAPCQFCKHFARRLKTLLHGAGAARAPLTIQSHNTLRLL